MINFKNYLPAIILSFSILSIWQIYASSGLISQRVLPAPSTIFESLLLSFPLIFSSSLPTILEITIGFSISTVFAIVVATAIFLSAKLKKALYPLLVASQTIPIIALAPLLLIWFGFGITPKIIVVVIYSFFPIAIALSDGLINSPKHLSDYLISQGANRWQALRYVNYPYSLDRFFSGLKVGAVFAVTGAVVGEFVGAYSGLGVLLQSSAYSFATARVFAIILVIMLITFLLLGLIAIIQKFAMPWKRANND